jgi:hypothetical protein
MTRSVRRRLVLALAVLMIAAAGTIVLLSRRESGSPTADAPRREELTSPAPVSLEAAGPGAPSAPRPERAVAEPASEATDPSVAVLQGTLVRAEDGVALPAVKFSLNFRLGDSAGKNVAVETDAEGRFTARLATETILPLHGAWFVRTDLWLRGYALDEPAATDAPVEARPGETVRFTVRAAEVRRWKGIVVDEHGQPLRDVRITTFLPGPNDDLSGSGMGGMSGEDGRFQATTLADPDLAPTSVATGAARIQFVLLPRPPLVVDVRQLTEADQTELRVVLPSGRRVVGRLVDGDGRNLASYLVTAGSASPGAHRVTSTDASGAFTLMGIPDGPVTIGSFVADLDLEARQDLTISGDLSDLVLVARAIDLSGPLHPVHAMGLRLIDVTEELRTKYELPPQVKVMVLDPGVVGGLFGAELRPGTGIWMIGDAKLTSVKDLVERTIAEYDRQQEATAKAPPGQPRFLMIRIVTAMGTGQSGWTNTQYFSIDARVAEHLRRLLPTLR